MTVRVGTPTLFLPHFSRRSLASAIRRCWILVAASLALFGGQAAAGDFKSVAAKLSELPMEERSVGTALRLADEGAGPVMLRAFGAGEQTPPHRPRRDGVRIAVVVSGTLSHGVGEEVDRSVETAYSPGDVLFLEPTDTYWFAAREGPASILFVFADEDLLSPAVRAQME